MRTSSQIKDDIKAQSKVCGVCGKRKSFEDFYNASKKVDGKCPRCKPCELAKQKEWRSRGESKELNRVRYRKRLLRERYGMTISDYKQMLNSQRGRCLICNALPDSRNGYLSVDHDHITGKVRGLLCSRCNLSIGKMDDSPALLRRAARYIEESNES